MGLSAIIGISQTYLSTKGKMMNERIKELAIQANLISDEANGFDATELTPSQKRFAELIVQECGRALNPMLRDMISRGQGIDMINKHFGVE
jgi:hypothetical protein